MAKINFEQVDTAGYGGVIWRGKVRGGWILATKSTGGQSLTFFPDPKHQWR